MRPLNMMLYLRGSQPFRIWGLSDIVSRAASTCCPESSPWGPCGQVNFANKLSRHCKENKMGMQKEHWLKPV